MKKQTIFFDVGNVLVFFSHVKMIEKMANLYDSTFDKVLEFILAKNLQENYEVGKLTTNDVCSSLNNEFHKNTSTNELQKALNYSFHANDQILPLLNSLKEQENYLVLLSNTNQSHFDYLYNKYPFLKLFDDKILSHEVSMRKPNPEIYKLALSKAIGNSVFIDDLEENVKASKEQGLDAIVYKDVCNLQKSLSEKGFI